MGDLMSKLEDEAKSAREGNADSALDPRYQPDTWNAPAEFWLSDGRLKWNYSDLRTVRPDALMLRDFVRLADADAQDVLAYAHRYGPLLPGIPFYRYMLRYSFTIPPRLTDIVEVRRREAAPDWMNVPARSESVDGWISLAREIRAMLNIAQSLHLDREGRPEDWTILGVDFDHLQPWDRTHYESITAPAVHQERTRLASYFGDWSAGALRGINIEWWDSPPKLSMTGIMLFGALALRVAGGIVRSDKWEVCPNCNEPFPARQDARRKYPAHCEDKRCQSALATLRTNAYRARKRQKGGTG